DTLYTLPVQGMQDYKLQAANSATYIAKANDILAAGKSHVWTSSDPWSKDEQDFYWKSIATCGTKFAQTIIDYIMKNYGDDKNVAAGIDSATTGEMLKKSKALTTAYGMAMWGFGGFTYNYVEAADGKYVGVKNADGTFTAKSSLASALKNPDFSDIVKAADGKYVLVDGKYVDYADSMGKDVERYSSTLKTGNVILNKTTYNGFKDATGKAYTLKGEDYPTAETYFSVMCAAYADENGNTDYKTLADTEKTESGYSFITAAGEEFAKKFAASGKIESISGIKAGKKTIDGVEYETVTLALTEQNPKAILSLTLWVAPKAYYTKDYKYDSTKVCNAGVELNSTPFMDHLRKANLLPVGAGPYKMSKGPSGKFYSDNNVYFIRNEQFDTMGGSNVYNAKIKNVVMKVITLGAEYDSLESGEVMFATVDTTTDVMDDLKKSTKLEGKLVDNNGYGYIVINPLYYPNIYARMAITSLFDLKRIESYYPNGLADVIYRCQSKVSWGYPENATAVYPFDETTAFAKTNFEKAGYKFENGKMIDPKTNEQASFVFTLPSAADDHPSGAIFIRARELLQSMGAKVEIKMDENLIANIKTEAGVAVYALAWQSSADPDMYQVYHYKSQADSVKSNGIVSLHKTGNETMGKVSITKLDGKKYEMTQIQALEYLASLIEEGTKYMLTAERKPIYSNALDALAQLSIEIPTYQRKNMFVFDKTVIDASTLSETISPYWGPMNEIWKVSFVKK
ncbi:MAG: hypothetical protein RR246_03775, partial [Clostridia bacterium]